MNQQPKEKPIVEILQDIHTHGNPHLPRGMVNPRLVNRITMISACICLVLTTLGFLAMIWDVLDVRFTFQCVGSMGVVLSAMLIFRAINEQAD